MSPLQKVTSIGSYFLFCGELKEIDLGGLSKVSTIGQNFLTYCNRLEIIKCKGKMKELIEVKYSLLEELIEKEVIDNKTYINDSIKIEI